MTDCKCVCTLHTAFSFRFCFIMLLNTFALDCPSLYNQLINQLLRHVTIAMYLSSKYAGTAPLGTVSSFLFFDSFFS